MFLQLYGYYPTKSGQGFEMLIAAAFKLLAGQEMSYDQRWQGSADRTSTGANKKGSVTKITLAMIMNVAQYEQGEFTLIFID